MLAIQIQVETTGAKKWLLNMLAGMVNPEPLLLLVGRSLTNSTKAHYRILHDQNPNKMGGKRQNFWLGVADSVNQPAVSGTSVTVNISHPIIAHKAGLGPAKGVITPKRKKWLAIPATKATYGLSPLSYESGTGATRELRFVQFSPELAGLMESLRTGPKGGKVWSVAFWLRKSVTQKPFPKALPSQEFLEPGIQEAADAFFQAFTLVD
jgi:hypothetical protein